MHAELNPQPLPPKAISVFAASDVLWDFDKFSQALRSVLDRAGHAGCTSGLQLEWRNFEQYYINPKLEATPVASREQSFGA
ncbi:hypothetical protein [Segeticoccus rhizosphaerae]|jgi:hypothetical protein|uniref:hypothetical protein n=1 Tax=Segeticoccus rhizosphaerae TaxID=1104777 RepID=UPI0010C045CF|nr:MULTISPECIES: hypothetical protein [Intrasporangiaceae]